jgi:hypothetical protein
MNGQVIPDQEHLAACISDRPPEKAAEIRPSPISPGFGNRCEPGMIVRFSDPGQESSGFKRIYSAGYLLLET